MALPPKTPKEPRGPNPRGPNTRGPNWGSIIAYAVMILLGLLALAPLLSVWG